MKIVLLFMLFVPALSLAETGPLGFGVESISQEMETDRPDFTEGTQTVTPGHLQVELGYGFVDNDAGEEHGVFQSLFRVGLGQDLEFRFVWDGYTFLENDSGRDVDGSGDISLGLKQHLSDAAEGWPEFSYIAELGLPVGDDEFTADKVVPAVKLLWAYDSVAGNLNIAWPVEEDKRFLETSASLALGTDLTEKVGAYVEYFGFYPDSRAQDSTSDHFINGGFTYAVDVDLQLDAFVGFGLNSEADDTFAGLGVSFRI